MSDDIVVLLKQQSKEIAEAGDILHIHSFKGYSDTMLTAAQEIEELRNATAANDSAKEFQKLRDKINAEEYRLNKMHGD